MIRNDGKRESLNSADTKIEDDEEEDDDIYLLWSSD